MPHYRPVIAPIPKGEPRPRWSVMIPTFNCARELRVALTSVLAKDPGPDQMQIEVVDDCSTVDDPERVVMEIGGGRVGFHRQPSNLGHTRNFNSCLQRSRGELVHLLHGDDFVLDGFYATMGSAFECRPEVGAAFCHHQFVDGEGQPRADAPPLRPRTGLLDDWLSTIAVAQRLQPPTMVVRRSVYEQLGGFDQRILSYGEDWEMWVRIAAAHPVWYQAEALAAYRIQNGSLSGRAMRTGQNVRDFATAIELNHALLPPDRARQITRLARTNTALSAIRKAHRMLPGDLRTPLVQLREAVRISPSPQVGLRGARLLGHWALMALARALRLTTPRP